MATTQVRLPAAGRRQQILNVAIRLFARRGYQGTTTRLIAERAGVNEALLFRHFPSKEDLYWAVIEHKIESARPGEHLRAVLTSGGTDLEVLSELAAEILERRSRDQALSRLLLYSALEKHTLSQRFFRTYVASYYEILSEYIRKRMDEGKFRRVNELLAARAFLGMVIYHSWVQDLYGGKRYQNFDIKEVSRTMAEIWLAGMQPRRAPSSSRSNGAHGNGKESSRVS